MTSDEVNEFYLRRATAMFLAISGKPCVHLCASTKEVQLCRTIYNLGTDDGVLYGECDWVKPQDERDDSLTNGLAIGSDLLDVGVGWWLDLYFDWYYIFTPEYVDRSFGDDHSWVDGFLTGKDRNRTIPRPPPGADSTHLLLDEEALRYYG
jgi:hypothetical protein